MTSPTNQPRKALVLSIYLSFNLVSTVSRGYPCLVSLAFILRNRTFWTLDKKNRQTQRRATAASNSLKNESKFNTCHNIICIKSYSNSINRKGYRKCHYTVNVPVPAVLCNVGLHILCTVCMHANLTMACVRQVLQCEL